MEYHKNQKLPKSFQKLLFSCVGKNAICKYLWQEFVISDDWWPIIFSWQGKNSLKKRPPLGETILQNQYRLILFSKTRGTNIGNTWLKHVLH